MALYGRTGSVYGNMLPIGASSAEITDAVWFENAESNATALAIDSIECHNNNYAETAWTVPAGVTEISIACMGSGDGGNCDGACDITSKRNSRGGGRLQWANGISVTPGDILYVHAGQTGEDSGSGGGNPTGIDSKPSSVDKYTDVNGNHQSYPASGAVNKYTRASYVRWIDGSNAIKMLCFAEGGNLNGGTEGSGWMDSSLYSNTGGGSGGNGAGLSTNTNQNNYMAWPRGSGGAGGWSGDGGDAASGNGSAGDTGEQPSSGGGGGGGTASQGFPNGTWGHGGHTYMWGEGGVGGGGVCNTSFDAWSRGGDGSQTAGGITAPIGLGRGGGGGGNGIPGNSGIKPTDRGWVRIMWEGSTTGARAFPSTNCFYPG